MRSVIIIPARLHSTRLPRKPLLCETGKPLVLHTYEQAVKSRYADGVCIAGDEQFMVAALQTKWMGFAGEPPLFLSDGAFPDGTSRVADLARRLHRKGKLSESSVVVNLQCDEPEIDPADIDRLIEAAHADESRSIWTLAGPIATAGYTDPNTVKVTIHDGRATEFSREPLPRSLHHIGCYAFPYDFLAEFRPPADDTRDLEQTRWMEAGQTIRVLYCDRTPQAINTPEDYRAFVKRYAVDRVMVDAGS